MKGMVIIVKHKVLLSGGNSDVINDFFIELDFNFDCITSSLRIPDLMKHLDLFKPELFVLCMRHESRDDLKKLIDFRNILKDKKIGFIVIADAMDYDFFMRFHTEEPELLLQRPISSLNIESGILEFINRRASDNPHLSVEMTQVSSSSQNIISPHSTLDSTFAKLARLENEMSNLGIDDNIRLGSNSERGMSFDFELERQRILIIDDSTVMLKSIKAHLEDEYEVATAISGKVALKFLEKKKVDLILLDYEMPDEDGPTVFKKIRSLPENPDVPIVFLTSINDGEKIQKALALKPQGYLLKPVDKASLFKKLHEVLNA